MKNLVFAFFLFPVASMAAGNFSVVVKITGTEFTIKGPIKGYGKISNGVLKTSKLVAPCKSMKTGIELRDEHTIKRLCPPGKTEEVIFSGIKGKGSPNGVAVGKVMVAGVTKKIKFKYKVKEKKLCGNFPMKMSEFGITNVSYLGVGVKDQVKVAACIDLK